MTTKTQSTCFGFGRTIVIEYDSAAEIQAYYDNACAHLRDLFLQYSTYSHPIDMTYLDALYEAITTYGMDYLHTCSQDVTLLQCYPDIGEGLMSVTAEARRYNCNRIARAPTLNVYAVCYNEMANGLEAGATEMRWLDGQAHEEEGQDSAKLYMFTYLLAAMHTLRESYEQHPIRATRSAAMLKALDTLITHVVQMRETLPSTNPRFIAGMPTAPSLWDKVKRILIKFML